MPAFTVRYYFGKDEYIEEHIEAENIEEARHLAFTRYKPSRNDTEFEVRSGDTIRVGLRDAVKYYTIAPAENSQNAGEDS